MGAETFTHYNDNTDAKEAFLAAIEEASWDYGHAGYTGTVAEKSDYVVIQTDPISRKDAGDLANLLIQNDDSRIDDKWGPAGEIPIANDDGTHTGWLFFGWASS